MVNIFDSPVIQQNLQAKFSGKSDAVRIAEVVDGLLGHHVKTIDGRSKKVSKDMRYHFDDPNGRIVRMERKLDLLLDHFGIKTDCSGKLIGRLPNRRRKKK